MTLFFKKISQSESDPKESKIYLKLIQTEKFESQL